MRMRDNPTFQARVREAYEQGVRMRDVASMLAVSYKTIWDTEAAMTTECEYDPDHVYHDHQGCGICGVPVATVCIICYQKLQAENEQLLEERDSWRQSFHRAHEIRGEWLARCPICTQTGKP